MAKIAMLGAGFIGGFYTSSLHGLRSRDKVQVIYSRDEGRGRAFAEKYGIPEWTTDMLNAWENGTDCMETFYDGYIVNEIMDACYRSVNSKKWEPVNLDVWRGKDKADSIAVFDEFDKDHLLVKEEVMPDGSTKRILKDKKTGKIRQHFISAG